jgi:hypothetical protein
MYRLTLLILCSLWTFSAQAALLPDKWQRVGQADLKMLWFHIYHAELLTSNGLYLGLNDPLVLRLTYKREISQQRLLGETEKELQRFAEKEQVALWIEQLADFWPDVKEGDQLAFYQHQPGEGHFFFNGRWLGTLQDQRFSRAFSSIWLSEQSRFPDLAASLRGEKGNEGTD